MGFTALIVQTFAGDIIDKTIFDRRKFLSLAAVATAFSASAILFVREGNEDHMMIFTTKIIEGVSSSFIGPCMAALTLATSGPELFDEVMASNIFWGHVGSIASALLAGLAGYLLYPNIKYCFLVIGFSALMAVGGVQFLPEGDPKLGRGLQTHQNTTSGGTLDDALAPPSSNNDDFKDNMKNESNYINMDQQQQSLGNKEEVASYWSILADRKTLVLCLTGFFFHFANANVLLVLGELMGGDEADGGVKRSAIPLIAGAIVLAQFTMSGATIMGDKLTKQGWGRKPLFLAGLITLPIRCALIIFWKDAGDSFLLSTQILDGLGGGFFGLLHPYLVNDIAFGSGRFNVLSEWFCFFLCTFLVYSALTHICIPCDLSVGLTASCFGLGGTLSNLLGQIIVEHLGHVASLSGSLILSFIPIALFSICMPETLGSRGSGKVQSIEVVQSGGKIV